MLKLYEIFSLHFHEKKILDIVINHTAGVAQSRPYFRRQYINAPKIGRAPKIE